MMYSDKLVVALKNNGKILREAKDTVYVPFGSEYSILIKNLNIVRCLVKISIDGNDISGDGRFVIKPGEELDLERSLANGNMDVGNKFKFIERTSAIEQHRGVQLEDGLIKVEFEFERMFPSAQPYWNNSSTWGNPIEKSVVRSMYNIPGAVNCSANIGAQASTLSNTSTLDTMALNDVGITVPGSKSDQKFTTVSSFITDGVKHVIVLKMLGQVGDVIIKQPITTKTKKTCSSCGSNEKFSASFCSKCGTSLDIF